MRYTVALTFLFVVLGAFTVTAQETAGPTTKPKAVAAAPQLVTGRVTGDKVNVRPFPATGMGYINQVFRGDTLDVIGKRGKWCRVKVPRYWRFWVDKKFLDIDKEKGTAVLKANGVNLRAGPEVTYDVTGRLGKGTKFLFVREIKEFACLKPLHDSEGWIHADFVALPAAVHIESDSVPVKTTGGGISASRPVAASLPARDIKGEKEFESLKAKIEADAKKKTGERDIVKLLEKLAELRAKTKNLLLRIKIQRLHDRNLDTARQEVIMRAHEERMAKIRAKLKQIDDKYKSGAAVTKDYPDAIGRIEKLNIQAYPGISYKLIQGEKVTFLLKSETVKLDDFVGSKVKLWGASSHPDTFTAGVNLFEVKKAEKVEKAATKAAQK